MITKLKVQIEEDKIIEEALKEQLEEKDRIIGNLEAKIVALRKDIQKKNMQNSSKVLDDIISSQKSHLDKSRLRYIQIEKGIKLQNNRERNKSKKLCRNNKRGQEDIQGRLQGHSSTKKIHISESTTDRWASRRRRVHKSTSFQNIFNFQVSNYIFWFMLCM
jgi:hypothetical protein